MTISGLDHFNIRARDMDAMRDFFVEVIGLTVGARPDFPFPGYWLYGTEGSGAVVHLVPGDRERNYVVGHGAGQDNGIQEGTGVVDHLAFKGTDGAGLIERLKARGIDHTARELPGGAAQQIFCAGPEGVTIEVVIPAA
ncbi:MAG: VOC family protein [Rhodospirillales bacterium]